MKPTILIFAIIATTTAINAQKPRIEPIKGGRTETYLNDKGGDFQQYTIFGTNDTVQQTQFYRNGQVERKTWKKTAFISLMLWVGCITLNTMSITWVIIHVIAVVSTTMGSLLNSNPTKMALD
jgi:hypothetical protein